MNKLKILELFGGIGACTQALKRLNIPIEVVDYVEIDKFATASYNAINNTNFEPQDITEWDKDMQVDLIMHGSPCQDFSVAGKQAGGDKDSGTRSSLMWHTVRIVEKLKPKYIIWENVKNLLSQKHKHNFDAYIETMEKLGYTNYYQVLNARDYGIPQNRERVYTVSIRKDIDNHNFKFPEKEELKLRLKDMLEDAPEEKYYINNGTLNNILSDNQAGFLSGGKWDKINESCRRYYKEDGISPTIHTCQGGNTEPKVLIKNGTKKGYIEASAGDSVNISFPTSNTRRGRVGKQVSQTLQCNDLMGVVTNPDLKIRKLTPKECWRLMGFADEVFEKAQSVNSNTQLYKQAGNSIVVNVLEKIFRNLFGGT